MIVIFTQPLVKIFTERFDELQLWWVMVFKRVLCNCREKEEIIRTSKRKASSGHRCDKHGKINLFNNPHSILHIDMHF